jgi:hypothetical protein
MSISSVGDGIRYPSKLTRLTQRGRFDKERKDADKGLVGEALKLSVSCNADTEEGAGVIFKVYPDGADPGYDQPVAELPSRNGGGKAEAEWTYRYEHDPENPLKEKPKYFFTANGQRCKEVKSGNVEIGQKINIKVRNSSGERQNDIHYEIYGSDGSCIAGVTDEEGRILKEGLIPGFYEVLISKEEERKP